MNAVSGFAGVWPSGFSNPIWRMQAFSFAMVVNTFLWNRRRQLPPSGFAGARPMSKHVCPDGNLSGPDLRQGSLWMAGCDESFVLPCDTLLGHQQIYASQDPEIVETRLATSLCLQAGKCKQIAAGSARRLTCIHEAEQIRITRSACFAISSSSIAKLSKPVSGQETDALANASPAT